MATVVTSPQARKRSFNEAELEIDVNAAEPLSKKALRKAKRSKADPVKDVTDEDSKPTVPSDLKRLERYDSERSQYGVWIGNLSFTTTKKDLLNFLTQSQEGSIPAEKITRMHLPLNEERRAQNRGFAYVDFEDADSVAVALALSESLFGGRRVLIKDAKNFQGRPEKQQTKGNDHTQPASRKIFIGNLDFSTSKEDLEKHFGVCGTIASVFLATFEDSGKCKGYGWIEFEDISSAEKAMRGWVEVKDPRRKTEMNSDDVRKKRIWLHRIGDRKLRIEYAEDAPTRYKKRFGKSLQESGLEAEEETAGDGGDDRVDPNHRSANAKSFGPTRNDVERRQKPSTRYAPAGEVADDSKYDARTVQRLTGAILEGQGRKIAF